MTRLKEILCLAGLAAFCGGARLEHGQVAPRPGFTPAQRRVADEIVSVFENDSPKLQYGYIENLHDGRGFTAGRGGFTSANGEILQVIKLFGASRPTSPLLRFVPTLAQRARDGDDYTEDLEDADFKAAWRRAAKDPAFRKAQDDVVDELDYFPALLHWREEGCRHALTLLALYDSVVQQGDSRDPDGVPALLQRTDLAMGGNPATGKSETRWLAALLDERKITLANPKNPYTRDEWRGSLARCDALERLLKQGNFGLKAPLVLKAFDDTPTFVK